MKKHLLIPLLLVFAIGVISGCGDSLTVAVSIDPPEVTLAPGATQQFTAEVVNSDITAVTWSVSTGGGEVTARFGACHPIS